MNLLRRLIFIFLFSGLCFADDSDWSADKVPVDDLNEFLIYYQKFLYANPFQIEPQPKDDKERKTNLTNHKNAAIFYNKLSEIAAQLARDKNLPVASEIKKEPDKRIAGTWNLYVNIPANACDIWAESCYLKYLSLTHAAEIDQDKIKYLHEFTTEIEKYAELENLFYKLKRDACLRSLKIIQKPLAKLKKNNAINLPNIDEHAKNLKLAVNIMVDFIKKYPTSDNLKIAEPFFETINLFNEFDVDLKYYDKISEPLKQFKKIKIYAKDQTAKIYAEIYEGMLRRLEIKGKPMPIWGVDINGNILDESTLKDKVVLLDFWAPWCVSCVAEFPHLKNVYQKYKNKGFEIVCYNVDSDNEQAKNYLKSRSNDFTWIFLSREAAEKSNLPSLSAYYGVRKLPVVLLRDRKGNVILTEATGDKLDAELEKIFDKK
ncbi:MAG: TlpA family protein disulfide reductase [Planctomycetaceae bacterium]|nr:TlpA family protein disulfide reductase [Planctomycetaceae bacterium]